MERIKELQTEIVQLNSLLHRKELELAELQQSEDIENVNKLNNDEIARYSRQMILPEIGVKGQLKLKSTSFLIVGAGGLGCPALQYLVSAGVGTVGIADYDVVEVNNLHRQILHTESNLGVEKVFSAKKQLIKMNSHTKINAHHCFLRNEQTMNLVSSYDIVLDCTDNVPTRYRLNDACYLAGKPLVSGSALKFEGQLTVYNYKSGPCYRCIFPTPPPPETVSNCSDAGVLGAVTGVIGSLQALEAIKIALDMDDVLSGRLLIFDGATTTFRNIKLRNKSPRCNLCSDKPIITRLLINYEEFCGMSASDKNLCRNLLNSNNRITVDEMKSMMDNGQKFLLVDVRSPIEYEMCHLNSSVNIPLKEMIQDKNIEEINEAIKCQIPVFLLCRRGNDSQLAVLHLREKFKGIEFKDIIGGLYSWQSKIDNLFPLY